MARSKKYGGQREFDLWGLSEQKAAEQVARARSARPAPREQALMDGKLDSRHLSRALEAPIMNHYGMLARDWWSKNAPERLASLEDPETFFEALGESATAQIAEIEDRQRSTLPEGLSHLETVGRLQSIRTQAEEIVLNDLVYSVPVEMTLLDELDDLTGNLPGISGIDAMIDRLNDQAEREAEIEDREPILDDEQLHRLQRLTRLRALIVQGANPDQLTAAEQRDLVLSLREFWDETTGTATL